MKKVLISAAIGILASAAQTQAMTWEVMCVKQGPARGSVAPLRVLLPGAGDPGNTPGYPIGARSIPGKAVMAENSDVTGDMNFISLGFGGQIILRSSAWIGNGPGDDITVFETTWGNPSCAPNVSESALVEVSEDGVNWVTPATISPGAAGTYNACHNGSYDISPLLRAQYVRITDRTNPDASIGGDGNDAYDVDGVIANYEIPTSGGTPSEGPICDYQQGVARQFVGAMGNFPGRGIALARKDFTKANINEVGFPLGALTNPSLRDGVSGVFNFWSLGFGGYACFKLPYTLFNGLGADIYIFESTWQNKPCPNYPEKAEVSVSADGINWSAKKLICKDALGISGSDPAVELTDFGPGFSAINYIRFDDASNPASFGKGADSYDIDNIYFAQGPPNNPGTPDPNFSCDNSTSARRAVPSGAATFIDGGVPEEMFALEIVGSNIVTDKVSFQATIAEAGPYTYSVRSSTGQEVLNGEFVGALYETPVSEISTARLNKGVYFLTLTSAMGKETVKFVKQ